MQNYNISINQTIKLIPPFEHDKIFFLSENERIRFGENVQRRNLNCDHSWLSNYVWQLLLGNQNKS
jgi:hypothetical protein